MSDTETVMLIRTTSTGTNVHGDPTGTAEARVEIDGALFAPNRGPGTEDDVGASTTAMAGTVFLPPGSPVPSSKDAMVIRGETWQVAGKPGVWSSGVEVFVHKAGRDEA